MSFSSSTDSGQPSLTPRNGHTLVVGIVARISGCSNQKEASLDDQIDHANQVVAEMYQGPLENRVIATKGKGERLDRPELKEIEEMLRSRELDLLVVEDIGRIVRGAEAARLLGIAVDQGTRVVAPNDCIDTADDSWEEDVISACRDHVGHNAHTSKRLKHKLMNRFLKFGGAPALPFYGYVKPPEARTYDDWYKDEAATAIYKQWFRILRETRNCTAVADWLTREGIALGPYCRSNKWTGAMVRRITRNPLLKGMPGRGFRRSIKHNETGTRVSVKNPNGPRFRECPHLAHVDPDEFDAVNSMLDAANKGFGRKPINGRDPLLSVPRKRTRFPGQHARCWYCGRRYVWGGNGVTDNLMCAGSREWACWNSIGCNGPTAVTKIMEAITTELYRLDGIDQQFHKLVANAAAAGSSGLAQRRDRLARSEESLARKKANLLAAIAAYGPKPMFGQELSELETTEFELARERRALEQLTHRTLELPDSVAELRALLEDKFQGLAHNSAEFGDLLRQIVPEFRVHLVRLMDGGHLLPRAQIKLSLAGIVPDAKFVGGLEELLTRTLTLDLFVPPQRERIREEAVQLAARGLTQREIATRLPGPPALPVVQRAMRLHRTMCARNLASPYEVVYEAPSDYSKLTRHKNAKYLFRPLEGYQQPTI
jgi:hypothetical protein